MKDREVLARFAVAFVVGLGPWIALWVVVGWGIEHYWSTLGTASEPWVVPYLLGMVVFSVGMKLETWLEDTWVDEWLAYGFILLDTLRYPLGEESEE